MERHEFPYYVLQIIMENHEFPYYALQIIIKASEAQLENTNRAQSIFLIFCFF